MTVLYLALLGVLLCSRMSVYTLAGLGMLVWSAPILFADAGTPAAYIFCAGVGVMIIVHCLRQPHITSVVVPPKLAKCAVVVHLLLSITIIVIDGGLGRFLAGKYGPTPGGSLIVYYLWNSLLYIAFAFELFSGRPSYKHLVYLFVSLGLLVVYGDRTILSFVVIAIIAKLMFGRRPIMVLSSLRKLLVVFLAIAVVFFAKDFYAGYAEGQSWSSLAFAMDPYAVMLKLEFWHNYSLLNSIVSRNLDYSYSNFAVEPFAFLPGSSFLGIDPHQFSKLVKREFYGDWTEDAGVGGTYFGQFFALGGWFGVVIAVGVLTASLRLLDQGLRSRGAMPVITSLAVMPLFVFYLHRNSVAQIASFSGRYLFIAVLIYLISSVFIKRRPVSHLRKP